MSPSLTSSSARPHGLWPTRPLCPWDPPGKNTGVGFLSLLQGISPTQGSNPGLLHCRQTLYPQPPGKPLGVLKGPVGRPRSPTTSAGSPSRPARPRLEPGVRGAPGAGGGGYSSGTGLHFQKGRRALPSKQLGQLPAPSMINARCEGAAQTARKWLGTREGQGRDGMHSRGSPPSPPKPPPSVHASPTSRDAGGGDSGKLRQGVSPWLAVGAAGRRQVSACVAVRLPRGGVEGRGVREGEGEGERSGPRGSLLGRRDKGPGGTLHPAFHGSRPGARASWEAGYGTLGPASSTGVPPNQTAPPRPMSREPRHPPCPKLE